MIYIKPLTPCFDTTQSSNQVNLVFSTDLKPEQVKAQKYNPTTKAFGDVAGASVSQTTKDGKPALQLSYTIDDNGSLDLDPTIGKITDPVGLSMTNQSYGNLATTGIGAPHVLLTTIALGAAAAAAAAAYKLKANTMNRRTRFVGRG